MSGPPDGPAPKRGDVVVITQRWWSGDASHLNGTPAVYLDRWGATTHMVGTHRQGPVIVHEVRPANPEEQADYWLAQGGAE